VQTSELHLATKESVDMFANDNRAFEIGEMSAVFQRDHAGIWNCLSDVRGRSGGDEVVIAIDDQRRDPQVFELGKQVVLGRGPCVVY
jgi:hypothetical protein